MLIFVLSQNLQPFQVATTRGTAAPAAAAAVETTSSNVGGGRALIMEGRKARGCRVQRDDIDTRNWALLTGATKTNDYCGQMRVERQGGRAG